MNSGETCASTVFIVDDDASICEAMKNLLDSESIAASSFASTEEFSRHWKSDMPGCLLLDVRLPGTTGIEYQDKLRLAGIHIPIIFMTAHGDVPMVRRAMKAGAIEFLTKPFQKEELCLAIQHAFEIDRSYRAEQRELASIQSRLSTLTPRETEVLSFMTAGALNKQIAAALNLSEIMIKLHRRHVFEKTRAESLAELVKMTEKLRSVRSR